MGDFRLKGSIGDLEVCDFLEEFRRGIEAEEFVLFLLPKFYRSTESIYGAEVLVRWEHPTLGLLQPNEFLQRCVECRVMYELDVYVWEHACQLLRGWACQEYGDLTLTVKVSEGSLYATKTAAELQRLLERYHVEQKHLQLEIEEDSIRADIYQAKEAINHLHELGFTIVLDDFSYGCSSISALNQIDVDILKVDLKFFSSCNNLGRGEAILASIIRCVNWLGMSVLAECVETREQNDFVKNWGCEYVQGFYFSKPIPCDGFEERYLVRKAVSSEETEVQHAEIPMHNLSVLVVDDTQMERDLLKKYLEAEFHIYCCTSAEEGLEYLRDYRHQVDLILVDFMMPGMNGIEFIQFCQLDERLKNIPKIMITSSERAKDQVHAFQAGAYDYLLKPLLPELVKVRVRHALEMNNRIMTIEQEKQEYRHLAETDKATGILNKISFESHVKEHLQEPDGAGSALLIIDIDDFKQVNDTQGHLVGDEVIKLIAHKLSSSFRSSDLVGRFGGDEFTVFMRNIVAHELVEQKAEAILHDVNEESMARLQLPISVSIGIGYSQEQDFFEDLFERADQALYQAKNTGKGRYFSS